jgi:hypothetical protein
VKKSERNELRKLRQLPIHKRTQDQIRRLILLAQQDNAERRVSDPIKPQDKPK